MRRSSHLIIFIYILLVSCSGNKTEQKMETFDTIQSMVMQIQKCSRLYSAECQVRKIISHDDNKKLTGTFMNQKFSIDLPFGTRKIAIPIDATLKAYIDFSDFSEANVKKHGKNIEIILPDPKIMLTATHINRDEVKQHIPILRSNFTDEELTSYERMGRDSIVKEIPQLGIIENARVNAARILIPLIEQTGYQKDNVKITFRRKYTIDDIPSLIDNSSIENGKKK